MPLALHLFFSIVFKDYEVKIAKHPLKRYAIFVFTFLPLLFIPFSFRTPYVFLAIICLAMMTYVINLYQAFWISTLFLFISLIIEAFSLFTFGEFFVLINFSFAPYVMPFIAASLVALSTSLLKKHLIRFIEKSHIIKNYQITYPLVIVSFIFFYCIYASLIFVNVLEFRVKMVSSILFVLVFIALAIAIIIFADRSLKSKNEIAKFNKRVLSFNRLNIDDNHTDSFTASVEFDLFNSESCEVIASEFSMDALLYKSNNSTIYLLKDHSKSQPYTMKVIEKKDYIDYDFERLKMIKHPTIVPIHLNAEGEKYHYIIKPFISGTDLNRFVEEQGPVELSLLKKMMHQLVDALDALHSQSEPIVYRDLKPSNIIFNPENEGIYLIDIESIRKFDAAKSSDTFIIGSRGYTPPEQYGFSQTQPRSDIYAFGATLYYLITGKDPDYNIISNNAFDQDVPPAYQAIIRKCMAFNPEDRYSTIKEIDI